MLSLEDFKKELPEDLNLSEEQIKKLRDDMDAFAEIFFEMWMDEKRTKK
jgi:hypothetical protein